MVATFQVCGHQPAGNGCTMAVSDLAHMVASAPIPIGPASPPAAVATEQPSAAVTAAGQS
ncbi:hypothetical protein [Kitasatospora sp. NPDC088351]|uniref:hypothetical protein n=1 Tax=unclassified Kitasatospora TaxID=2633591 RepID=UPI003418CF17